MVSNPTGKSLAGWLGDSVFAGATATEIAPEQAEVEGFERYLDAYRRGLAIERAAVAD